jgi:hypothetical protein
MDLFLYLLIAIKILEQGFAIGNGLTDPAIQYKAYTDYALDMGIIKQAEHDRISKIVPVCEMAIKLCGNVLSQFTLIPLGGHFPRLFHCF